MNPPPAYLLELARYVVLNPVRAGMVRSAREWPWSSYRATVGGSSVPSGLTVDWLLSAFGAQRKAAMLAYQRFVSEGKGASSPWNDLKRQVYLATRLLSPRRWPGWMATPRSRKSLPRNTDHRPNRLRSTPRRIAIETRPLRLRIPAADSA